MEYRTLGKTGIRISELFLGAMTFGEQGGVGAPLAECRSMLDAYLDAGGNVIDTAINYRGGLSEEIVGEILDHRRDRFVVASKYTVTRDPTDPNGGGNHRKNLRLSLETSLRRLRTDYLDLYWVHIWDDATPIEETMRALDDIVRTGKVLAIGISDTPAWVIARGHTAAEIRDHEQLAAIQVPYNLVQRDADRDLLPMAEAFGFTVASWSPLAGGLLSGKFTRRRSARWNPHRPVRHHPTAATCRNARRRNRRPARCHLVAGRPGVDHEETPTCASNRRGSQPCPVARQPRRRGAHTSRRAPRPTRPSHIYRSRISDQLHRRDKGVGARRKRLEPTRWRISRLTILARPTPTSSTACRPIRIVLPSDAYSGR